MDATANFAKVTVSTGYNSTAYTVVLSAGNGAKLPAAPFNLVWYNSTDYSDPSDDPNVEIVRCTNVSTDTLTLTNNGSSRTAQEGTSSSAKNTAGKTYKMMAGATSKTITDIASLLSTLNTFKLAATGSINGSNAAFTFSQEPTFIVSDGAWYTVGKGWTWNSGTLTATMSIPPNTDLYGIA